MSSLLGCSLPASQVKNQAKRNELEKLVLLANNQVGFNGVVLVSKDNNTLFETAIGKVGNNEAENLTIDYAFSPGSITKEFSVIALLRLRQEQKIKFEQSIGDYFPELPDWKHNISIEHLLTHSSGLPDVQYRANMTTADALNDLQNLTALKFVPGSEFDYGNNNTILRALVVERVSGKNFEDYLQEILFTPAGMTDTFGVDDPHFNTRLIAHGAIPLSLTGVTAYVTARDLLKLEMFLWHENGLGDDFKATAITQKSKGGQGRAYYDFGFYKQNASGEVVYVEHDGTYPNHYALKRTNFVDGYSIVLLSNDGRRETLGELRTSIVNYLGSGRLELPEVWRFINDIKLHGSAYAVEKFREQVAKGAMLPNEEKLNNTGYEFFYDGDLATATAVLKLSYELFPDSLNAVDSYAEVLLEEKQFADARQLLEKGLQLAKEKKHEFYIKRFSDFLTKK